MATTLTEVLEALYSSEINASVHCFWDCRWQLRLGDDMNGYDAHAICQPGRLDADGARWLAQKAVEYYPGSRFALAIFPTLLSKDRELLQPVRLEELDPDPASRRRLRQDHKPVPSPGEALGRVRAREMLALPKDATVEFHPGIVEHTNADDGEDEELEGTAPGLSRTRH